MCKQLSRSSKQLSRSFFVYVWLRQRLAEAETETSHGKSRNVRHKKLRIRYEKVNIHSKNCISANSTVTLTQETGGQETCQVIRPTISISKLAVYTKHTTWTRRKQSSVIIKSFN